MKSSFVPKLKFLLSLSSLSICIFFVYSKYYSFPNYYPIRNSFLYYDNQNDSLETYLVDTNSCRILHWSPFNEEVLPFYMNLTAKKIRCFYDNTNIHRLKASRVNSTAIFIKNLEVFNYLYECFAFPIIRHPESDEKLYLGPKLGPLTSINHFKSALVKIKCSDIKKNSTVYEEVIPLIQPIKTSKNSTNSTNSQQSNIPNILMIGLDSVSRLNFLRHFPFTTKLLEELNFHPLYGYTKVADNTFVNLVPLLTGNFVDQFWNETISSSTYLNFLPFIWKQYEAKGHLTMFGEDASLMSTFNFLKLGFKAKPTHYYLRPFSLSIEKRIRNHCYKDRMELEVYLDYLYDFIHTMNERQRKYFSLTFMARLTHDELNNAGYADLPVYEFFTKLSKQKSLNNTVIIFFSDHGIRFGPIRRTLSGKLEERLPFIYVHIPDNISSRNLEINKNRLTTPFDIHAMLTHILNGKPNTNLSYGLSLLEEIPKERSCTDAAILEHWCVCQVRSSLVENKSKANLLAQFIVETLNNMLDSYRNSCHTHELDRVLSAYQQHFSDKFLRFRESVNDVVDRHVIYSARDIEENIDYYLITLITKPEGAIFEATVRINQINGQIQILGDISRINRYGSQNCISNSYLKKYCLCK